MKQRNPFFSASSSDSVKQPSFVDREMDRVPCVVIGAGAVGLAVGRAMCGAGVYTMVLEKHSAFGTENSSRNSEVLHAGLYYPVGSAKARFCNDGKNKLLTYMKDRNIPHNQCGKLVIASSAAEIPTLHKICKNGAANGLNDLRMVSVDEARVLEPSVSCVAAMLSPFTGIFDSHTLMLNYVTDIETTGSDIVYNCEVNDVSRTRIAPTRREAVVDAEGFEVHTTQGTIQCEYLINCAGLSAPLTAHRMDFYPRTALPPTYFAKGNYFKLRGVSAKEKPFKRLIYPIPQAGGLGVHATLDMEGNVKFGPNVEWLPYTGSHSQAPGQVHGNNGIRSGDDRHDKFRFPPGATPPADFTVRLRSSGDTALSTGTTTGAGEVEVEDTAGVFCKEISKYWPAVRRDILVPDYAGIRPKLCGPPPTVPTASVNVQGGEDSSSPAAPQAHSQSQRQSKSQGQVQGQTAAASTEYEMPASADFAILGEAQHGVRNLVCLFGIESPGLTASMAIADHVRDSLLLQHSRS